MRRRNHAPVAVALREQKPESVAGTCSQQRSNYTRDVRVRLATILALFILTIACVDPLYCADGCERGNIATTHSAQSGADCPTCLSALLPRQSAALARVEM